MPTAATLLVAALILVAVFSGNNVLRTESAGTGPITAAETAVPLSSGSDVVIDDAAIATQGDGAAARTVKEFNAEEPFSMFALTWYGEADMAAFVRAENEAGEWGPWYETDPIGMLGADGKTGTELIYIEPTTRVQVNVSGIDLGLDPAPAAEEPAAEAEPETLPEEAVPAESPTPADPAPLPSTYGDIQPVAEVEELPREESRLSATEVEAVFIDGKLQEHRITQVVDGSNTNGMPEVISRAGWGANEKLRCSSSPTYSDPVSAVTVHHTAGSNNYSSAQSPGIMRGIYQYHASTLNWCDVGYGALIDKYGTIYEGRSGGLDKAVQGAHVGGFNENTWGIAMMGNYETVQPTEESIQALGTLAGWKAAVHGFDPQGSDTHYAEQTFSGARYNRGQGGTFPNINSHRHFHYTECPGEYLYSRLDDIRAIAATHAQSLQGTVGEGTSSSSSSSASSSAADAPKGSADASPEEPATDANRSSARNAHPAQQAISDLVGSPDTDRPALEETGFSPEGDSDIETTWRQVLDGYGDALGQPTSDLLGEEGQQTLLFERGLIINSDAVGTRALWGAISEEWIAQGLDLGPLGLPLNEEYRTGEGDRVRVDFEGGHITYDPDTRSTDVHTA